MSAAEPYPYIYINADGTARELHADERAHLETPFKGGDGAMPYIKASYETRNGWHDLAGYLERAALPAGIPVADAPAENPNKPMNRGQYMAWLRAKGAQVTENADGSFTIHGRKR